MLKNFFIIVFILIACEFLFGCDEDVPTPPGYESDNIRPVLLATSPSSDSVIAFDGILTMTFNEQMGSVTVNGSIATNSGDGKTWKWIANGIAAGVSTLKISGADVAGNKLDDVSISLIVSSPDTTAPYIVANSCIPINGATDVNPEAVNARGSIIIVFSETMSEVKCVSFEPGDAKVITGFLDRTFGFSFTAGYQLGNDMTVKAKLTGKDKAGNALESTIYTFSTRKKEQ